MMHRTAASNTTQLGPTAADDPTQQYHTVASSNKPTAADRTSDMDSYNRVQVVTYSGVTILCIDTIYKVISSADIDRH